MKEGQPCPSCLGKGYLPGIACPRKGTGCIVTKFKCFRCGGSGALTQEAIDRIRQGQEMRKDRMSRGFSLMAEAERLGISPSKLNALENGDDR